MAYIKKLKYNELVGGTDNTDVYPVTSTEAVYGPDNINQQVVNEDRLRRIELLESNVQSLDGLKEMVEAFISGDYDYQGGLSDNNFTDELKAKLEGLENYNDAELRQLLADIDTAKANAEDVYTKSEIDDKLGDIQGALTFDNTPIADSDNPVKSSGIYTALQGKQDTISDLNDIRTHASEFSNSPAASITSTNINSWNQAAASGGTITGITMNGSSKGTSGVVDLGTVVTQEADPTVPQWAKTANKPAYTAQEVGALPADTQFMNINGTSVKSNNSINVYSQTFADNKFATKTELNGYATENYVTNALANVVYIGDDAGSASSSGEGEGGGEVTPSGDYVTTSDFNAAMLTKANDSAVVHKTGSETISGEKNFNDRILLHSTAASEQEPVEGEEQATTTEDTVLSGSYIYHQGHDDFSWIITSADEETNAGDGTSLQTVLNGKQAALVSGTNIKTVNNTSILGNGNIPINADTLEYDGQSEERIQRGDSLNQVISNLDESLYQGLSAVVHKTGNETITGVKTFDISNGGSTVFAGSSTNVLIKEDTVSNDIILQNDRTQGFEWIQDAQESLQDVLDSKVNTSSDSLLPTVTTTNNGKILKVVNGVWKLSDDATGGSGGVDSTAVHQTGAETIDGVKTLIGILAVEDGSGGKISCTDLNNFDWIVARGGITLQSVLTAMANRITALENKLASLYSFDSTNSTLTINDPNSSNS